MKTNQIVATGLLLALIGFTGPRPVAAQETTATLVGNITDSTGAVAPAVAVRATNLATNTTREALTDGAGNYSIPFLPAGDYTVTVSHASFMERRAFEFRAEFFNLLKHYNPDPQTVDTNLNSATFGSVGGGVQGIATRVTQLGAKLHF